MYLNFKMVIIDYETLCLYSSLFNAFFMPQVTNCEEKDEMNYETSPQTEFQKFISLARAGENLKLHRFGINTYLILTSILVSESLIPMDGGDASQSRMLYDHQPLNLKEDDFERVCQIPKKKVWLSFDVICYIVLVLMVQYVIISCSCDCTLLVLQGANFRDLSGVLVQNNRVKLDPSVERAKVKSGKFLVHMNPSPALRFFSSIFLQIFYDMACVFFRFLIMQ